MEHRIGPHLIDIHGDTAFITLHGDFLVAHTRPMLALLEGIGGGEGKFYVLADVKDLNGVQPEARRIASSWSGVGRAQCTAIIGANLVTRTLVLLVSRASTLLTTSRHGEVRFFKTESEAREWVAACGGLLPSR